MRTHSMNGRIQASKQAASADGTPWHTNSESMDPAPALVMQDALSPVTFPALCAHTGDVHTLIPARKVHLVHVFIHSLGLLLCL